MSADRIALVTGAASGIGRATARRLADDGYLVCGLDRDAQGLEETGASLRDYAHRTVDLADVALLIDTIDGVVTDLGIPDLLVNNAGIGVAGTAVETGVDDWDLTLAVNLSATFHTCRVLLPHMIDRGHGVIVNVASVAGIVAIRRRAAYCASKAGVIGLTRALAADHATDGIRANAICPGTVETGWIDRILADAPDPEAARSAMHSRQLDGRMGTPEEIAGGIAFLASDDARFVNGSAFVMDGGLTAV